MTIIKVPLAQASLPSTSPATAPSPPKRLFRKIRRNGSLYGTIGVVGFLVLWQVVVSLKLLPRDALPSAVDTLRYSAALLSDPAFLNQLASTVTDSFVGLGIALLIAVPAGFLIGISDRAFAFTSTVIELLRPLPPIAFVPLAVLVLGQGTEMKAVIVALGCVWPLLTNLIHGVHSTESVARSTGRSFGWSEWTVIRRVVWPSALPSLMTGIRITVSIALILCIGAEFIGGSTRGLGSWMLQQSMLPDGMNAVAAGVVIAGVLGIIVNAFVAVLDRRFAGWATRGES